jgi:hypothetical protein
VLKFKVFAKTKTVYEQSHLSVAKLIKGKGKFKLSHTIDYSLLSYKYSSTIVTRKNNER